MPPYRAHAARHTAPCSRALASRTEHSRPTCTIFTNSGSTVPEPRRTSSLDHRLSCRTRGLMCQRTRTSGPRKAALPMHHPCLDILVEKGGRKYNHGAEEEAELQVHQVALGHGHPLVRRRRRVVDTAGGRIMFPNFSSIFSLACKAVRVAVWRSLHAQFMDTTAPKSARHNPSGFSMASISPSKLPLYPCRYNDNSTLPTPQCNLLIPRRPCGASFSARKPRIRHP